MRIGRAIAWILPIVGLGVIGFYVRALGADRLSQAFHTMGGGVAILLALPIFMFVVNAVGWSFTLSPDNRRRIGLLRLCVLQTFSYGISGIVPMQMFVAEPLKMAILADTEYDREDFAASLLVDNTINGFAIFAFVAAGVSSLGLVVGASAWLKVVTLGLVALMAIAGAALIMAQRRGLFTGALNLLARLPALRPFCQRHRQQAERVDGAVRRFYAHNRRAFYLSLLFHLIAKAHGVAEFWWIFKMMGIPVSWGSCFFIASVVNGLDNALFFIHIGGIEAGISSLLSWMGLARDSINITAALFRRLRFLFWALVALLLIPATRRLFVAPPRRHEQSEPGAPAA